MQSYVHRSIFKTNSNIYDGAFFTSFKPYFQNVLLNSIELPLGSTFYITHPFAKKLTTEKTSEKKSSVDKFRDGKASSIKVF